MGMKRFSTSRGVRSLVPFLLPALLAGCGAVSGAGSSPDGACAQEIRWPDHPESIHNESSAIAINAIVDSWEQGPNFACSALVVTWGCGTGCVTGGIYDAESGVWFRLPFAVHRDLRQQAPLLSYSPSSPLLTATGWLNEEEYGVVRYEWDGTVLIRQ